MIEGAMSMDLLRSYVKAVRRYLPRGQRDDIVAELTEELRSEIEAREADLDHPLRDHEQMAVFTAYGNAMIVARRYRQKGMSLSLGWELIGPELFPMYLIILGLNLTLAIGTSVVIMAAIAKASLVFLGAVLLGWATTAAQRRVRWIARVI